MPNTRLQSMLIWIIDCDFIMLSLHNLVFFIFLDNCLLASCKIISALGVVVITTVQLHLNKPEFRFCAGSNPACSVSEIGNGEDLWQWSWLEIRLYAFLWSTITQKQLIITIIIIISSFVFAISFLIWDKFSPCCLFSSFYAFLWAFSFSILSLY